MGMQRIQYGELLEDDQQLAREREGMALDQSILLLEQAGAVDASSVHAAEAIAFTSKLWTVLVEDLANPENGLPKQLRAQIVSIGIWILRDLEQARTNATHDFSDVVAVSKAIRGGLT
jgi:flagellar biosynthesis activator protein FlaF